MTVTIQNDHGELKRHLADLIGSDPGRYGSETGTERHKCLTAGEVARIADELGLRLEDEPKQAQKDAVMLKLGRDHRTGTGMWDSSDLVAVINRLEDCSASAGTETETGGPDNE